MTPIEFWPIVRRKGRAGYSAAHFAAVSPQADNPLLVAERLAARVSGSSRERNWSELCESWDFLIATLERHSAEPQIAKFLKAAVKAKKSAT